jgi:signal transduction histidine kinase
MYVRLTILSVIILAAVCGLSWLGYRAIEIRAQGLEGARLGQFAEVAEQIRQDVKRKLDEFMQTEQQRPWTDYQYYYVPENMAADQQMPLLRSPLGDRLENNLAYGNFQIEPEGTIVTPYVARPSWPWSHGLEARATEQLQQGRQDEQAGKVGAHLNNIRQNLLPALSSTSGGFKFPSSASAKSYPSAKPALDSFSADTKGLGKDQKVAEGKEQQTQAKGGRKKQYTIDSLQEASQQAQVINQPRSIVASNMAQNVELALQHAEHENVAVPDGPARQRDVVQGRIAQSQPAQMQQPAQPRAQQSAAGGPGEPGQTETVQIRIEPFVPLVVPSQAGQQSVFGGQVFLLRHVQIEDRHLLQGFQLNEKQLIAELRESAERFMREGMTFELVQTPGAETVESDAGKAIAYTAILDFGFGDLVLKLKEIDPAWIAKQISQIRNWYFSIITVVLLAVMLALGSLWLAARAQIKLAQKKDDFISAVSHELRTPLTSIRMYSEMLEKNWVKSKDKLTEYYKSMRQESERLSRLIENVLDFSRIQRGRKKYAFGLGDINACIAEVVEMMTPYAAESGFSIRKEFGELTQAAFDRDAVTQIVVNLLDNAIKYARSAEDKTITVRTRSDAKFVTIEVEDHGPGVPHRQRKKVFEQFYRCGCEATRETAGTGLGLALVKKFAQAHNGFVEILTAKPTGAIFRVALAAPRLPIRDG